MHGYYVRKLTETKPPSSRYRYVGNLPPMPGVFPEYPAQVTPQRRAGPRDDAVARGHAAAQDNGVG